MARLCQLLSVALLNLLMLILELVQFKFNVIPCNYNMHTWLITVNMYYIFIDYIFIYLQLYMQLKQLPYSASLMKNFDK